MSTFDCGIRVTCSKCGRVVCANPSHEEGVLDIWREVKAHKLIHERTASGSGEGDR